MKDEEKKTPEEGERNPHRGGKEGKGGRKDKRQGVTKDTLNVDGKSVSTIGALKIPSSNSLNANAKAYCMAVLHTEVDLDELWTRAMYDHEDEVRDVIRKVLPTYFNAVSPTAINTVQAAVGNVVKYSLLTFAQICHLWKMQNANQFEDEDGFHLDPVLNCATNIGQYVGSANFTTKPNWWNQWGHWGISNAAWKKEVLAKLNKIYLKPEAMEFIYTMFGHFIKFDGGDDSHEKLWDLIPEQVVQTPGNAETTYSGFISNLDSFMATIDAQFDAFPFLNSIMALLGLVKPGDKYDFTRDLAQMAVNVMGDREHVLEDMCYMTVVSLSPNANPGALTSRIVSSYAVDGSYFEVYKDDPSKAKSYQYISRLVIGTESITNAIRGLIRPCAITAYYKELYSGTKYYCIVHPYNVEAASSVSNSTALRALVTSNNILNLLDMPNDAVTLRVEGATLLVYDSTTGLYAMSGTGTGDIYYVYARLLSGDYVISENDAQPVVSDACVKFLFDAKALPATSQTLGNDGKI